MLRFNKLHPDAVDPSYATPGSSGMDIATPGHIVIGPRQFQVVPTGLSVDIPEGYELQIRPRSGLAAKYGVTVLNAPGTVDSDYKGEIKIILVNHSESPFFADAGARIAQAVLAPVVQAKSVYIEDVERGVGGFGSTGV